MIGFSMDVGSFQVVVGNLRTAASDTTVIDTLGAALADVLFAEVTTNLNYTDHTRADFRRLDHPYARRHGRIQVHGDGQRVVHKQSGEMLASLRVEKLPSANSPTGEAFAVWFDVGAAAHAAFVVRGTRYMLPRDVLWATTKDPRVQKKMMKAATKALGPVLRSKSNLRFNR